MSVLKQRIVPQSTILQVYNGNYTTGIVASSGGFEVIETISHDLSSLGSGDCGGPMQLHRDMWYPEFGKCFAGPGKGSTTALHVALGPDDPDPVHQSTLWGLGATAIARSTPTDPAFDGADVLAQSIQFREAIPKAMGSAIWREKMLNFRALGKEYLNVEFGWKPFVNDILDVMRAVRDSDQYIHDLKAGNGKKTRVGYRFPTTPSYSTDRGIVFTVSADDVGAGYDAGDPTASHEFGSEVWFKGCFNYQIPFSDATSSKSAKFRQYAEHILGLKTPGVQEMWDAAPWTWAVDWAVNVGDVAHNIDRFHHDGLTLQYGYIMGHNYVHSRYWAPGGTNTTGTGVTRKREWKSRFPASPYGFGLTWDGLTASQQLILASIGITHI